MREHKPCNREQHKKTKRNQVDKSAQELDRRKKISRADRDGQHFKQERESDRMGGDISYTLPLHTPTSELKKDEENSGCESYKKEILYPKIDVEKEQDCRDEHQQDSGEEARENLLVLIKINDRISRNRILAEKPILDTISSYEKSLLAKITLSGKVNDESRITLRNRNRSRSGQVAMDVKSRELVKLLTDITPQAKDLRQRDQARKDQRQQKKLAQIMKALAEPKIAQIIITERMKAEHDLF